MVLQYNSPYFRSNKECVPDLAQTDSVGSFFSAAYPKAIRVTFATWLCAQFVTMEHIGTTIFTEPPAPQVIIKGPRHCLGGLLLVGSTHNGGDVPWRLPIDESTSSRSSHSAPLAKGAPRIILRASQPCKLSLLLDGTSKLHSTGSCCLPQRLCLLFCLGSLKDMQLIRLYAPTPELPHHGNRLLDESSHPATCYGMIAVNCSMVGTSQTLYLRLC